jgi:hypothetical protein
MKLPIQPNHRCHRRQMQVIFMNHGLLLHVLLAKATVKKELVLGNYSCLYLVVIKLKFELHMLFPYGLLLQLPSAVQV